MPIIARSSYSPPWILHSGHLQSILPVLSRRVTGVTYRRQRLTTPDDDFLDLDLSPVGADRLAILSHGLEGSSERPYVRGMVRALNRSGWDALAWNFRGCSGEPNRQLRFYHSGDTEDLDTVVSHVLAESRYSRVSLIGFSLGGNVTLKYLGELGADIDRRIVAAVAFSVPCDLASAAVAMSRASNAIYMKRFLRMLHVKIRWKMQQFPGVLDDHHYHHIHTFHQFDERYIAPLHGFLDAADYYERASSLPFLAGISIPTLLVNAADDPFLAPACYPLEVARKNGNFYLEIPSFGGHVGFMNWSQEGSYWSEQRTVEFLRQVID